MKVKNIITLSSIALPLITVAQERPNIVFILADDMRGSTIELLGKERIKTPNLNKLASDGVLFSNAYIMGGSSGAVSMPSRAMFLTGKHLHNLKKEGSIIPEEHTTIGESLQKEGYETYHIGKWHSDTKSFNRTFNDGNDIFFGGMADHWNIPLYSYNKDGDYSNKITYIPNWIFDNKIKHSSGEYMHKGKHSVDIFTDRAIEYINNSKDGQPFYLNIAYTAPHDPRSTHSPYHEYYNNQEIELPANFLSEHPFDNGQIAIHDSILATYPSDEREKIRRKAIRDETLANYPRRKDEILSHIRDYYAMITHLDESVGHVIRTLKEKGIYDNTIVVFTGDNGLAIGQHGLMGKQSVYEHSVSIPLIIKDNVKKSSTSEYNIIDAPCYLIDVMPTLLEYAGAEIPKSVDALSIMPAIKNGKHVRSDLYFSYTNLHRAISDMKWKLIEYNIEGKRYTQLFNLVEDPMECNNIADIRKYRKIIASLRKKMLLAKKEFNDNSEFWNKVDTSTWSKN